MLIFRLKTKFLRVLDCKRTTNANKDSRSNDGQNWLDGISENMPSSSQKAYPKTANTKNSVESDALMNNPDNNHGKIQSPQDEDMETNFNSLNPAVAKVFAEDQTNTKHSGTLKSIQVLE